MRGEDIEAILRRVDHNANQRISYEEFNEITSVNEFDVHYEEQEKNKSPIRKELSMEILNSSPVKRSNSREYQIYDSIEECMEKRE